jgi:hypothetical protein
MAEISRAFARVLIGRALDTHPSKGSLLGTRVPGIAIVGGGIAVAFGILA